ncbi:hypothetical protein FRC10_003841 [Ceratobasidium sp. 414]|nr:hypothetical protein FRC10_003841 [Ceratobasidium sp. 414]
MLDTVEPPPPAKKQKAMAKEVATKEVPKGETAGANSEAAADPSLPPPAAPKKTRKEAADLPAEPAPGPSDADVPPDPSTSASKRRRRPPMRPPPDSPLAQTTTRAAKEELVDSVETSTPEPNKTKRGKGKKGGK